MNKWSKLPALVLALGLVATACSTDPEPTDNESTDPSTTTTSGSTLAKVLERGRLVCGVNGQLLGFSLVEEDGSYSGLDADYCRGVAAAVLGDANLVDYVNLTSETRFTALQSGDVDVLIRNGTWTSSRDGALGLQWTATTFYDGQGMLVNTGTFGSVADMDGAIVCVQTGTTTEINLDIYFNKLGISYEPLNVVDEAAVIENFSQGACDGYTTDKSGLAAFAAEYDGDVTILEDTMSKEPLGPAVLEGDEQWFDMVQWVVFATFQAEEFGLTAANIGSYAGGDPATEKFIAQDYEPDLGFADAGWVVRLIEAIGNYQEIYDRNITPIGIPEGLNQLYTEGGILYSPPFN